MKSKIDYLVQTENAVKGLFKLIEEYLDLIELGVPPCTGFRSSGVPGKVERLYDEWKSQPEIQEQFEIAQYAKDEYRGQLFSMQVVAGSIFQIACKAIELFSEERYVDSKYQYLLDNCNKGQKIKAKKFCVGREVRGVPLGLIIYAARNQYNHIESGAKLNDLNRNVFCALSNNHGFGEGVDSSFSLKNDGITCYSFNLRALIGWSNYEVYRGDMNSILSVS